jgi:hypothetical protein
MLNHYHLNNLSVDLEKKISLYKEDYNKKQEYIFNDETLKEFSSILVKIGTSDVSAQIKAFNEKNKVELELNNDSLEYPWRDISALSSELYAILYDQFKDEGFEKFLDIIKNKLPRHNYHDWFNLSFENNEIKNHFLDNATEYIIQNQISSTEWVEALKRIDLNKNTRVRYSSIEKVSKDFNSIYELFYFFKEEKYREYSYYVGSSLIVNILSTLIDLETYNPYQKSYERIHKIIKECANDYVIMGNILTSNSIRLNTYFLTQKEYTIYGFLNLYNLDSAPNYSISDDNTDYVKQWKEMLSNQLVNIFFEHFKYAQYEDSFSEPLYSLLNYLVSEHIGEYNNQYHYKANYTLNKVLEKIASIEIATSEYEKKYLFDLIVDELVSKQLERFVIQDEFNTTDYFLLSWYLEQIDIKQKITDNDYNNLIDNITVVILDNIKKCIDIAINEDKFYINDEIFERVNFGLIFTLSKEKEKWLNLLDFVKIKEQLNSNDIYIPLKISEFYIKILMKIYKETEDSIVAEYVTKLTVEIGVKEKNGVFADWQNNRLLDDFLEVLNSFNDDLFDEFTTELYKKKNIKHLLQLHNYTLGVSRKIKIKKELDKITKNLNNDSIPYLKDLEDAMMYASTHDELKKLNDDLFNIYKNNTSIKGYPSRKKEYAQIICQRELLNIYNDDTLSREKKHIELNKYTKKIKEINDRNYGIESTQIKCENYQSFIHAIVWFDTEPFKTYQLLRELCDKELNNLYLINMISAYFRAFQEDDNKIEKYTYALNEYEDYYKKLNNPIKSLFDYQVLIYGYTQIENTIKLLELNVEIPKDYISFIKKELPKEISFFNAKIIMKNKVIVCVEGENDIAFLKNINQNIADFKEIIDLKENNISIMDLGGSRLKKWIENHHLNDSNIMEIHIYDSDIGSKSTNQYKEYCEKVNNRDDKSIGFLTKKRELENYIHKSLIEKEFKIDMSSISDWNVEDIPAFIHNKSKKIDKDSIKRNLNHNLTKQITKEFLEEVDAFDEIKNWFEKIKELSVL